jgi:hypothetical protein
MTFRKITITLPDDFADAFPELLIHGRGADPRGHDIEAWERDDAERLARLEARRKAQDAADADAASPRQPTSTAEAAE